MWWITGIGLFPQPTDPRVRIEPNLAAFLSGVDNGLVNAFLIFLTKALRWSPLSREGVEDIWA